MQKILRGVLGVLGAIVGYLYGGINSVFYAVLAMMAIDWLTGILSAWHNKSLDSRVGLKGIIKKIGELITIAVAHIIDANVIGGGTCALMTVCELFFIANEGISIIENLGEFGVPIPEKLKNVLAQLKEDNDKEE